METERERSRERKKWREKWRTERLKGERKGERQTDDRGRYTQPAPPSSSDEPARDLSSLLYPYERQKAGPLAIRLRQADQTAARPSRAALTGLAGPLGPPQVASAERLCRGHHKYTTLQNQKGVLFAMNICTDKEFTLAGRCTLDI